VCLKGIQELCQSISKVSKDIIHSRDVSYPVLSKVRASLKAFNDIRDVGYGVDCETLFERLSIYSNDSVIKSSAAKIVEDLRLLVVANYASKKMKDYSPRGLALYFPKSRNDFEQDPNGKGYLRKNTHHKVDFVHDVDWALLLSDYLKLS
jgi:hypothetical protein